MDHTNITGPTPVKQKVHEDTSDVEERLGMGVGGGRWETESVFHLKLSFSTAQPETSLWPSPPPAASWPESLPSPSPPSSGSLPQRAAWRIKKNPLLCKCFFFFLNKLV